MTDHQTPPWAGAGAARDRELAHLSFNFVLDIANAGISGLKSLDSVLVMAINQANIAPLTRDPAARSRYGALDAPAPDVARRPVSVRAVAASMRLPYETARRHIRRLEAQGACVVSEAGVVVPEAFLASAPYLETIRRGHERLFALYLALRERRLLEPLPPSHFDEDEPPVRGVARLLADFLLRIAEAVGARSGDLVGTLVLLPVLAAAAGGRSEAGAAIPVAGLARRTQLPAETVRRRAAALVAEGLCASGRGGVSLADADCAAETWRSLFRENAIAVQRMFAGLAERGVVDVWDQLAGLAPDRSQGAA